MSYKCFYVMIQSTYGRSNMFLGVVSSIVKKDYSTEAVVDLCDRANELTEIIFENASNLEIGDLLFIKLGENQKYDFEKIAIPFFIKYRKLDENFLFQLFNLIDKEIDCFETNKETFRQLIKEVSLKNLNADTLIDMVERFSNLKKAIRLLINEFRISAENIKVDLNNVKKYMEIQCMKIIVGMQFCDIDFKEWINNVTLLLCLSDNKEIDEELLTRAIKILLNAKIANNETNELKSQLEQQLKEKLNELKGKQKKLV